MANETRHLQYADNVALKQYHALVVWDAAQAQKVDSVKLYAGALEVADARHLHLADGVRLTQYYILTVSDALQAQIVDPVTLSFFIIDDALHARFAGEIGTLTVHINLVVEELLHTAISDDVQLVEHYRKIDPSRIWLFGVQQTGKDIVEFEVGENGYVLELTEVIEPLANLPRWTPNFLVCLAHRGIVEVR